MSKRGSVQTVGLLMFFAVFASSVEGICWSCLPSNLSEEEIDKILAEELKDKLMEKLGLTSEPVMPDNITTPPEEVLNGILTEGDDVSHEEQNEGLQTIILQPLNDDSKMSNTTSFFEYQTTDDLDRYDIEHVILWLHVKGSVGSYRVYEKMSSLPRRMIFMGKYEKDALEWKKITFTPNKLWLENPLRKLRIEVKGLKESVSNKPMLQVDFKQKKKRLTKRHAVQTTYTPATATVDCPPNKKNLCCRHNRVIQLKKHYDWILYPKSYRAYTCAGDCNLLSYRKNSTWSLLAHAMNPQRTPCCIPTAFESLSVIARASGSNTKVKFANVKKVTLKDVVVKSCGCS